MTTPPEGPLLLGAEVLLPQPAHAKDRTTDPMPKVTCARIILTSVWVPRTSSGCFDLGFRQDGGTVKLVHGPFILYLALTRILQLLRLSRRDSGDLARGSNIVP